MKAAVLRGKRDIAIKAMPEPAVEPVALPALKTKGKTGAKE